MDDGCCGSGMGFSGRESGNGVDECCWVGWHGRLGDWNWGVGLWRCWMERVWKPRRPSNADGNTTLRQLRRPVSKLAERLRISSKIKAGAVAAETACQQRRKQPWTTSDNDLAGSFLFITRKIVLLQQAGHFRGILDTLDKQNILMKAERTNPPSREHRREGLQDRPRRILRWNYFLEIRNTQARGEPSSSSFLDRQVSSYRGQAALLSLPCIVRVFIRACACYRGR